MTDDDFSRLKRGDIVRHKHDWRTFVVTSNYGNRITAVTSVDMTNPPEWEFLTVEGEFKKDGGA